MTTVLIVVGVIVFLIVDAIILAKVLGRHKKGGGHSEIPVPGETVVALPAGKVSLTYQESKNSPGGGDDSEIRFYEPDDLVVSVIPPDGSSPLPIKGPGFAGMGSSKSSGFGKSKTKLGTVEVPADGAYTVRAECSQTEGLVEPKILIG